MNFTYNELTLIEASRVQKFRSRLIYYAEPIWQSALKTPWLVILNFYRQEPYRPAPESVAAIVVETSVAEISAPRWL